MDSISNFMEIWEDVSPIKPAAPGELLISQQKHREPESILLQQRDDIWYYRDYTIDDDKWLPLNDDLPWLAFWKKYAPLRYISLRDFRLNSLTEYSEILSWLPADSNRK